MPPPSPCPVCTRCYCDHTCFERGQTYAQMMGDPSGTHEHHDGMGCLCDDCTAPGMKPLTKEEWATKRCNERVFELLQIQAVERIVWGDLVRDDDWSHATIVTEEDSSITVRLRGQDMRKLGKGTVSHVEMTEDGGLFIWTDGRWKVPVSIESVCFAIPEAV